MSPIQAREQVYGLGYLGAVYRETSTHGSEGEVRGVIAPIDSNTNQEVLRQEIEYTDFPLSHIKLYLVEKVLMLPNEY